VDPPVRELLPGHCLGGAIGVRRADSLAELMGQCDFVSIHTRLTAETRGLIGPETFAAAKRGMILINAARGPVVDIDALYDAMKDGTVLVAGLDVLPNEPANAQRRLIAAWQKNEDWIRHRLLLTPHSAFYTPESLRDNRALRLVRRRGSCGMGSWKTVSASSFWW
jgi:phosphoglycerate dehydrogenase-like enzyme